MGKYCTKYIEEEGNGEIASKIKINLNLVISHKRASTQKSWKMRIEHKPYTHWKHMMKQLNEEESTIAVWSVGKAGNRKDSNNNIIRF